MKTSWRKYHKWVGLPAAVFIIIFCLSGIILNHRNTFAGVNVSRALLPSSYHVRDYNNGIIKGTAAIDTDSIITYGNGGLWLTDRGFTRMIDFNTGLPSGIDYRNIKNVLVTEKGDLWCAAQFGLYHHPYGASEWSEIKLPGNMERLSDITFSPDSGTIMALTRSEIYTLNPNELTIVLERHRLASPEDKQPSVTLFKTVWMLHSGELFGLTGRIVVDVIALILLFLSITGLVIFFLPINIKRLKKKDKSAKPSGRISLLKWNFKWHDRIGYVTAILTVIIAVTGMCLRPPLMIPLALTSTKPMPGSALDSHNYWHDKLRAMRYDRMTNRWLLSTSEGFFTINLGLTDQPQPLPANLVPPVSPMGINFLEQQPDGSWLAGSFSGLYRWNIQSGEVTDVITGKPYDPSARNYGLGSALISGASLDLESGEVTVFDYAKGNRDLPPMDSKLASQPISLWNTALELHVGRCYTPFLGPLSELFVFVAGLLITLLLISGIIINRRNNKKHNNQTVK